MFLTILAIVIIFGVSILIHEFGHFLAAKKIGVKVEEFGVGIPPRLYGKKIGETIYSINALPLGGFVRLFGEEEGQGEKPAGKDLKRAFFAKTTGQRAFVLLAGVFMNFLLGWLVISFLFTQGVQVPTKRVHVEEVEKGSPAQIAGLQKNDVILDITDQNGKVYKITSADGLVKTTDQYRGKEITLTVERNSQNLKKTITPRLKNGKNEGAMGVTISNYEERKYPFYKAPYLGLIESANLSKQLITGVIQIFYRIFTFQGVSKDVAGPIGIAQLTGQAVQFGIKAVLELMALLSLNLAIVNVLPLPPLDGGRLLFVVIEGVTKRKVRKSWERNIVQVGLVILLILLVLASVNDVMRLMGK